MLQNGPQKHELQGQIDEMAFARRFFKGCLQGGKAPQAEKWDFRAISEGGMVKKWYFGGFSELRFFVNNSTDFFKISDFL